MGFIKKLIAGILGFVAGLLPGKNKGSGYYLELKEANEPSPKVAQKPVAAPAAAATVAANGTKPSEPVVEAAPAKAPAKTKVAKGAETTAAKPVEAVQNGKSAKTEPAKPAAPAASTAPQKPTETTFAPKYLTPSASGSNGRRRPGANMSSFLDMARQVKTPG
jgi:hypothetical protein